MYPTSNHKCAIVKLHEKMHIKNRTRYQNEHINSILGHCWLATTLASVATDLSKINHSKLAVNHLKGHTNSTARIIRWKAYGTHITAETSKNHILSKWLSIKHISLNLWINDDEFSLHLQMLHDHCWRIRFPTRTHKVNFTQCHRKTRWHFSQWPAVTV